MLVVFSEGETGTTWLTGLFGDAQLAQLTSGPTSLAGLTVTRTDYALQEDALLLTWQKGGAALAFGSLQGPVDLSGEGDAFDVVMMARAPKSSPQALRVSGACTIEKGCAPAQTLNIPSSEWTEVRVPLACLGVTDVSTVSMAAAFSMDDAGQVAIADLHLEPQDGEATACPGE